MSLTQQEAYEMQQVMQQVKRGREFPLGNIDPNKLAALAAAYTGQSATAEPSKAPVRTVSRTWTLRGVNGTLVHVSEIPSREHVQITIELTSPSTSPAKLIAGLDRRTFEALMELRDEILERWTADQTIEALGK